MNQQDQHQLDTWAKLARIRQHARDMGIRDGEWPMLIAGPALILLAMGIVSTFAWVVKP